MMFDSSFSYTISPGTGGTLTFNNSGANSTLTSNQGNHTIATSVQLATGLNAAINVGTFTISGAISGSGGISKMGAGALSLISTNSYTGFTSVQAGKLSIFNRGLADAADVYVGSGATLDLKFSGTPDVIDSLFIGDVSMPVGTWGPIGSGAQFTTSRLVGTGLLQVTTYIPSFLSGDYNSNGIVDTADYVIWRRNVGNATIANRDPANSGPVGDADFNSWRSRIGTMVSAGSGASLASAEVPEPTAISLLLIAVCVSTYQSRRCRQRCITRL
jgi:autotransporter-associated beta strand protein